MEVIDTETGEVRAGMPPKIAAAIIAVKKQVKQLGYNEVNPHAKYNYVSVDKFYAIIGPLMAEHGIALLIDETETEVRAGDSGKPWLFAHYSLAFVHESGCVSAPMRRSLAMPINGPQTYGAAQSYIEKQFLRQVFKIPTGERAADETEQGDTAPAVARHTQGSARPVPQAANQQRVSSAPQNGPAALTDRQAADNRVRELERDIDACSTIPELERIFDEGSGQGCPAWVAAFQALERAVGTGPADAAMGQLAHRIARRRGLLLMDADRASPLPI